MGREGSRGHPVAGRCQARRLEELVTLIDIDHFADADLHSDPERAPTEPGACPPPSAVHRKPHATSPSAALSDRVPTPP